MDRDELAEIGGKFCPDIRASIRDSRRCNFIVNGRLRSTDILGISALGHPRVQRVHAAFQGGGEVLSNLAVATIFKAKDNTMKAKTVFIVACILAVAVALAAVIVEIGLR